MLAPAMARATDRTTESILKKLGNIEGFLWLSASYGKLQRVHGSRYKHFVVKVFVLNNFCRQRPLTIYTIIMNTSAFNLAWPKYIIAGLHLGRGVRRGAKVWVKILWGGGGGGGCSKVCKRRMTCPPTWRLRQSYINIIFCSASCLLYTPESNCLHLTSLHKHTSSFWKSFVLHTQQWSIVPYHQLQRGKALLGGGGGGTPPPPIKPFIGRIT